MTSESSLHEDEGGSPPADATSNVTDGVKNPLLPMHKVLRRKKKDDAISSIKETVNTIPSFSAYLSESSNALDTAMHYKKDAEIARKQSQQPRYKQAMAQYHHFMAMYHDSTGDKAAAADHRSKKAQLSAQYKTDAPSQLFSTHAMRNPEKTLQTVREIEVQSILHKRAEEAKEKAPSGKAGHFVYKDGKQIYFYDVPFSQKEEAKKLGMKWNAENKAWYSFENKPSIGPFKRKT